MKLAFVVQVELNDEEFANMNAKRKAAGAIPHTPEGWVENNIHHGLSQKGVDSIDIAPAQTVACGHCDGNAICSKNKECTCHATV